MITPKPTTLSMAQAAASGVPYIVAFEALVNVGDIREGETLLLTGANGAVGRVATQIVHWRKAKVIGVQRNSKSSDADAVVDTSKGDMIEAVKTLTNGKGVDIALDAVGGEMFESTLKTLRLGGRQVAIASPGKRRVEFDLVDFYHNAASLHGVDSSGFSGERVAAIQELLRRLFEEDALRAPDVAELPFERAVEAYEAVRHGAAARHLLIFD